MNAFVSATILSSRTDASVIQHQDGAADFVVSPHLACHYDRAHATLWSRWQPRGVPSFSVDLLRDLERASQVIEGHFRANVDSPLRYVVLKSGVRNVFNLGGDLGYFQTLIAAQDRAGLADYARSAVNAIYRNYVGHGLSGVTTIALLEGDALGGGFECALSCDMVVAERHVKAGFPEVLFNMFPGMGGISFLARRVGRKTADDLVRSGRQYTALELLDLGVVDRVVETGEGERAVRDIVARRQHQQAAHAAMNRIDRMIRPVTMQELYEVVTLWVECAMQMSPRSLEWMQRLYQRQLAVFGRPLESCPAAVHDVQATIAA
jgi:DSF synthase